MLEHLFNLKYGDNGLEVSNNTRRFIASNTQTKTVKCPPTLHHHCLNIANHMKVVLNENFSTSVIIIMALGMTTAAASLLLQLTEVSASITTTLTPVLLVPIAISDDNIYLAWPTNKTGNYEVMFRASTDGGTTFTDKINLSNSSDAESQDVQIAADNDNVIVTWWERNATSNEPVVTISTDNGTTFAPITKLAANGTIGMAE